MPRKRRKQKPKKVLLNPDQVVLTKDEFERQLSDKLKAVLSSQNYVERKPLTVFGCELKMPSFVKSNAPPQELFPYLLAPSLAEIKPDHARFNEMRHRVVQASGYPRHVEDAWLQTFLSKNEDYDISTHIEPLSINDTLAYLHNQIIKQSCDQYSSQIKGIPNQALEVKLADTKRLYEALYKGEEKIFRVSLYLDNKADSEEKLNCLTEKCKSNLNSLLIMPKSCTYRMASAVRSCLPLGVDDLKIQQEFSTNSLAATIPFISSSCGLRDGVLLGKEEETKTPVYIDFDSLPNKHFFILGTSGSGKSYTAKYLLIQLFIAMDARIYVLDPNSEYRELCERFGGQTIELSRNSESIINIFDLSNEDFGSKMLSLISIFDIIVDGLSESQKGVLNRILLQTYELKGIVQSDPATWSREPPTFSDFQDIVALMRKEATKSDKSFSKQESKSLEVLSNRAAMYVKDGFFGFLDRQTRIDLHSRFINFDLSKLPSSVRTLMMFATLDFLGREVKKDNKPKVLLIDEGWALLRSKEAEGYMLDFVKSSRKYGASMGFITQEIEDLLSTDGGRSILNQTATKILMHQNTTNIDLISDSLKLNSSERDFLVKCSKGHGLLISGENRTRFFTRPSNTIHEMITTDPAEVLELAKKDRLVIVAKSKRSMRAAKPLSPEEEVRWEEKETAKLDPEADYYKCSLLSENQKNVLKRMGYVEESLEPFGARSGPKWLVKPRGPEGALHALMVLHVRDAIKPYCPEMVLSTTVEPDIVALHNGKRIAFEIETGSWILKRNNDLEARFKRLKEKYPDGYYIIVTHTDYETDYQPYGTVITKSKIKEFLASMFA